MIECLFVLGVLATLSGVGMAAVLSGLDDYRAVSAARYLSGRLQRTRTEALTRGANTAFRVTADGSSYRWGIYEDGNGDGVRSRDIQAGIDLRLGWDERLTDQFPGVDFGALPDLPAVDAASGTPGSDPIKLGSSNMASFTPLGNSSPGSLYVLGPHQAQYVIRVYAETGKIRILKFNLRTRAWDSL